MKKTIVYLMVAVFALSPNFAFADTHEKCSERMHQECKCDCPHKKEGKCDHKGECKNCEHCSKTEKCSKCNGAEKCQKCASSNKDMAKKCEHCKNCDHKNCKSCKDGQKCEHCKENKCKHHNAEKEGLVSKLMFWK